VGSNSADDINADSRLLGASLSESVDGGLQNPPLSLKEQMDVAMKASMLQAQQTPATSSTASTKDLEKSLMAAIKTEMSVLENNGVRGRCLQFVYTYLLSVPPTSVEAERAFSAAGLSCTKIRSRLCDNTLDNLCFPTYILSRSQII